MEIKINTKDLVGDECSVREEIISLVVEGFRQDVSEKVNREVNSFITNELQEQIKTQMTKQIDLIIHDGLDYEYTEVDKWADSKGRFTIRQRIAEIFKEQAVFKKGRYDSDKNVFTKVVEELIAEEISKFKSDFSNMVNRKFLLECQEYAVKTLRERLKV